MKKLLWFYPILLILGLVVLSWPEENNLMMVKFSETHGPSGLDTIGLLLIMIGYVPLILMVIKRFRYIRNKRGKTMPIALTVISIVALIMIAIALNISNDLVLWISVAISTICQSFLVYDALTWDRNSIFSTPS